MQRNHWHTTRSFTAFSHWENMIPKRNHSVAIGAIMIILIITDDPKNIKYSISDYFHHITYKYYNNSL